MIKRLFLISLLLACGSSTTTGEDASTDGALNDVSSDVSNDVSSSDASSNDASSSDASNNDAAAGDAASGAQCDPNANNCGEGLLCCSEPTHSADGAASIYECEPPTNGHCPLFP